MTAELGHAMSSAILWGLGILSAAAVIGFVLGRVRCPRCGNKDWQSRDRRREAEISEFNDDPVMKHVRELMAENRDTAEFSGKRCDLVFVCRSCGFSFDREDAREWERVARKFGEDLSLREFQKLQEGNG